MGHLMAQTAFSTLVLQVLHRDQKVAGIILATWGVYDKELRVVLQVRVLCLSVELSTLKTPVSQLLENSLSHFSTIVS